LVHKGKKKIKGRRCRERMDPWRFKEKQKNLEFKRRVT